MWIARDKGGDVNLFWSEKPQRIEDEFWGNENNWCIKIPIGLVPVMISWDDEPIEVDLVRRKTSEEILDDVLYSKFGM